MFNMVPASLIFYALLILSTLMAVSSSNWLIAWVSMEMNLLSFIPMILSSMTNQETESAIKYFLAQALGSAMMLFSSMSMLTTHTNMMYTLLILSLALKLGAAPCHYWLPSVVTSMSWTNAMILSTWQKLAPLCLLVFPLCEQSTMKPLIFLLATLNSTIGGLIGMNQTHMRSILAYSSITHMGWTIGAFYTGSSLPSIIYFMMYSLVVVPLFIMFALWNVTNTKHMSVMLGSAFNLTMLSIMLLSLSGMPPLTGFLPKWFLILLLSQYSPVLTILLILGSMMNLYFYLNLLFTLSISSILQYTKQVPKTNSTLVPMFLAATSLLGLMPVAYYAMTLLYKS